LKTLSSQALFEG